MSNRKSLISIVLCLAASSILTAQTTTTVPSGEKMLVENGKPVTGVRFVPRPDGSVWFLIPSNDKIVQLQPDGVSMKTWQIRDNSNLGANPVDLRVDGKYVYFIENGESLIDAGRSIYARLDTETGQLREWDIPGSKPAGFYVDQNNKLWIPQTNGRLQSVDLDTLAVVDYRSSQTFAYADMVLGPDGALWLADFGNNRIVRYVPGAATETSWTFFDPNNGRLNTSQIAFDDDGNLWLCQLSGGEVQMFDPKSGALLTYVGFTSPIHFDIFAGRVYVTEAPSANGAIVVLDPTLAGGIGSPLTSQTLAVAGVANVLPAKIRDSTITPTVFTGTPEFFAPSDLVTTADAPGFLRVVFPSTNAYGLAVDGGTIWVGSESLIAKLVIQAIGDDTNYTVPVAAEFGVSPGDRISTDAVLSNRGTANISGDILFLYSPAAFAASKTFSVDGGKTILLSDVLGTVSTNLLALFGPVRIRVLSGNAADLLVTVRTASEPSAGGNFGFSSRGASLTNWLGSGSTRVLFTGTRDKDKEVSVFGLYSPNGMTGTARLYAADGTLRGQRDFRLAMNIAQEFNPAASAFGVSSEPGDIIVLNVASGSVQAYVNILDLGTSDVAFLPAIEPTDDAILPILGTLQGIGDTSFVSDLFLANPDSTRPANLQISFVPLGQRFPTKTSTLTLPPSGSQIFTDVLGTLFSVTAGQGTILVSSDVVVAVAARIASRKDAGDYASFVPAFNGGENVQGGQTATAIGVPQNDSRGTSLFLYNRGDAGTVTITGFDGDGNQIGALTVPLDSGQATRVDSVMTALGSGDISVGKITVVPSDGMVLFAETAEGDAATRDTDVTKLFR